MTTQNAILKKVVDTYISQVDKNNVPAPEIIEAKILEEITFEFQKENTNRQSSSRLSIPKTLPNAAIASILVELYYVRKIFWGDHRDNCDLAVYQSSGPDEGLYVVSDSLLVALISRFNYDISAFNVKNIMALLDANAPVCTLTEDPDLIPVNNGIFNYKTKELMSFSPDYVFVSKSNVNYNPDACNVIVHNSVDGSDWDVETWIAELSDDSEVVKLIWQMIGAVIRPNVRWNKVLCLYSERGNNGKGTLCELLRGICGEGRHTSLSFSDFGHEFKLEALSHVSAVITDENATGFFSRATAELKAVITNDKVLINRKYKNPIAIRFRGLMVQCINDLPKFSDKSESLYRRFLFVPFDKCFTGYERKYIKADYLHRQDVLEYVLYKVLNTNFYAFDEPRASRLLLSDYKISNDPVRDFLDDILPQCVWSIIPYAFLYDLYKSWFSYNCPSGQPLGKRNFIHAVKNILIDDPEWSVREDACYVGKLMDAHEPLIYKYKLTSWMNPNYKGSDIKKICDFERKVSYRGILRK